MFEGEESGKKQEAPILQTDAFREVFLPTSYYPDPVLVAGHMRTSPESVGPSGDVFLVVLAVGTMKPWKLVLSNTTEMC